MCPHVSPVPLPCAQAVLHCLSMILVLVSRAHQEPCAEPGGAGPAQEGAPSCAHPQGAGDALPAPLQPCPSSALCLCRVFCPIYLPQMSSPLPTPCDTPQK